MMKAPFLLKSFALLLFGYVMVACQPKAPAELEVSGIIDKDTSWTADTTYILNQKVIVAPGATLNIEAGTVIKAYAGEAPNVSMLVIAKGGKINAIGTAEKPIIFTSLSDDLSEGNMNNEDSGLWGGVILLGDAPISLMDGEKSTFYIGLDPYSDMSFYGGDNAEDNSGVMEYVSIRHGGTYIGTGSESNGLTLCGVGAKTKISNIEIFANLDDGIEFFGGTVNASNLIIHSIGDDGIDIDEGYTGTISNFVVELGATSDNAIEISGGQGDFAGKFTLENGLLDGKNVPGGNYYSIDENAEGSISALRVANFSENALKTIKSEKVTIENAEENAQTLSNFDWTLTKSK